MTGTRPFTDEQQADECEPEHGPAEQRCEGTPEQQDLRSTRHEKQRVERLHHSEVTPTELGAAARERALEIPPAQPQLEQALQRERSEQEQIEGEAHQRSRTNSAQKPGPIAIISP